MIEMGFKITEEAGGFKVSPFGKKHNPTKFEESLSQGIGASVKQYLDGVVAQLDKFAKDEGLVKEISESNSESKNNGKIITPGSFVTPDEQLKRQT